MIKSASAQLREMEKAIRKSFSAVKEELNVHLETINQNSTEVQTIYDYLEEIDSKIEKLNERIDELQMYVNPAADESQFNVELTHREQEVFMVLYSEQKKITAKEVAKRLGFSDEMVNRYVYNIISKGVPILKQFVDGEVFLYLDLKFKDLQTRKGVIHIDESISKQLLDDNAL